MTTHQNSVRRQSLGRWFADTGWRYLVGVIACAFALFPLLYIVSVSFNPTGTLTGSNHLFESFDLGNYERLLSNPATPFGRWFLNTMVIGIVSSVATVFLGALAAYAFSRMRFTGRRVGLLTLLLVQMFPQFLAVVAIFLLMVGISDVFPAIGLGTSPGLILVYLGGALGVNTFLMYGFFNTIPTSIDEAAKIDGAGHARTFFTIVLPLVTPILAVVGLLSFIGTTSEFVIASVLLTDTNDQTLALGLYTLISGFQSQNWGVFAAGSVLAALPVVALFLFLQRYIVSGLSAGSVK
ncbi:MULTISPECIES: sugar ABC transporter permease [Cryobacterium]|uniref:sugar ABC transporter permease n=1 Tax=Cryobacterium TaxID=69578 RepID=UPI000CD3DAE7|nr:MULTISPECIES: sugar ABC transporter permease [Cryobacterium]POH64517.1 sugar ABC transporter permease [Cryobacterium zongtaii]TFC47437.1 sugar ABC transporter permease [Cryobacterium sp. TMN-39-2]TFC93072.1 sugar ABC transporter permease [Cryobacterium sp. TMT4-31]